MCIVTRITTTKTSRKVLCRNYNLVGGGDDVGPPVTPPRNCLNRGRLTKVKTTAAPSRSFQRRSTGPPWQALSTLRSAPPRTLRSAHPRTLRSAHPALSRGGLSAACIRLPHSALRQTLHGGRVRGGRERARESERERGVSGVSDAAARQDHVECPCA